ncbi:MAG TPA: heavy metal-binding domain-containing protein [Candidatus Obscuribacterales bacterium]
MEFVTKWIRSYQESRRRDEVQRAEQEKAIAALKAGELFPRAKERIDLQNAGGANTFCSDLSVREYLLSRECGLETIGQVMGSCFYNISLLGVTGRTLGLTQSEYNADKFISSFGSLQNTGEMGAITEAQLTARQTAVNRMLNEAHAMNAHGVIGVRVNASHFNFQSRMTEFTAIGTAIRIPGLKDGKGVFTSDLNGQEFWQLYNAGYLPKELSFGVCSYYIKCDPQTRQVIDPTLLDMMTGKNWNNQEIAIFTQGFYAARSLAIGRLSEAAQAVNAEGIVSMEVDHSVQTVQYEWLNKTFHDLVLHFVATGTSIAAHDTPQKGERKPLIVYNLKGARLSSLDVDFDMSDYADYMEGE